MNQQGTKLRTRTPIVELDRAQVKILAEMLDALSRRYGTAEAAIRITGAPEYLYRKITKKPRPSWVHCEEDRLEAMAAALKVTRAALLKGQIDVSLLPAPEDESEQASLLATG